MLFCTNITKSFGTHQLLQGANFQLNRKERVGIVGRNGAGKSTLFNLIIGKDTPDNGEIVIPNNYKIGILNQQLEFSQESVLKEVMEVLPEDEKHSEWKAEKILFGLGFSQENLAENPEIFSGGFQIRIKLARLLLSEPDLLLLDEPTNYLDILSIRWLEKILQAWSGEVICVSHDHIFLSKAMTHCAIIHRQGFKKVKGGNPQKVYEQIAIEEGIHERTRKKQIKETNKQEKFIREFRSGARSAGLVQSRIKMLDKKGKIKALAKIPPIKFNFPEAEFNGAKILEGRNLSFGYGQEDLLKKISLEIFPGEKVAIIGQNGKGKSTLLKALAGEIKVKSGTLKLNNALSVGYFGQSNIDNLAKEKTILEALHVDKSKTEQEIRNIAGSLLFSGALAKKKISVLSGGEKARVNLGRVLLQTTNLLLLDEPTNHLDYESVEALIEAIKKYSGAVVVVAHDENFLQQVATKLVIFDNDEVFVWNGNYQDFIDKKGFSIEQKEEVDLENFPGKKSAELNYEERKTWQKLLRKAEKDLKKTEKQITELEDRQLENKEKVHVFLRQGNRTMLEKLGIESEKIQDELGAKLGKWEKLGEEIEFLHLGLD